MPKILREELLELTTFVPKSCTVRIDKGYCGRHSRTSLHLHSLAVVADKVAAANQVVAADGLVAADGAVLADVTSAVNGVDGVAPAAGNVAADGVDVLSSPSDVLPRSKKIIFVNFFTKRTPIGYPLHFSISPSSLPTYFLVHHQFLFCVLW